MPAGILSGLIVFGSRHRRGTSSVAVGAKGRRGGPLLRLNVVGRLAMYSRVADVVSHFLIENPSTLFALLPLVSQTWIPLYLH